MTVTLRSDDFDAFFDAPFEAYGPGSVYVSPMKADLKRFLAQSNPLFIKDSQLAFFTAHKDGRVVGRITAHIHAESNQLHGESRGYFGYFDCVDEREVAQALLGAAEGWLRDRQITEIAGNFNLTAMQQIGVMTGGFEHAPYTDQVWSPPHIARLLTEAGYEAVFPMVTAEVDLTTTPVPPLGPKQLAILDDPDFAFVPITRRTVPARMEDARLVLNASFAENPMFVPVRKEEFHFQAKDMRWIMDPRISSVIYHKDAPAGCVICVPDLNPFVKKIRARMGFSAPFQFLKHRFGNRRAVLIFAGVMPHLHGRGINPLMLHRVFLEMKNAGYETVGNTWIGDENGASLAQKEKAGARAMHRLHLFRKAL